MSRTLTRQKIACFRVNESSVVKADTFTRVMPLEIRGGGIPHAVTMRTFKYDYDVAADFLVSWGLIAGGDQFASARHCAGSAVERLNTYSVLDDVLATGIRTEIHVWNSISTPRILLVSVVRPALTWCVRSLCMK